MNVQAAFREAMEKVGFVTADPILADGLLHRIHLQRGDLFSLFGWYIIFPDDVPCGAFGNWFDLLFETWCGMDKSELSEHENRNISARMREVRTAEEREFHRLEAEAPEIARKIWNLATPIHEASQAMQLTGIQSDCLREYRGSVIVPLVNEHGEMWSLQVLMPHGSLPFQPGSRLKGAYHVLGEPKNLIYVAVDFFSAATIYELTDEAVVVAFADNNLLSVAQTMRKRFPKAELVIVGNDDLEEFDHCSMHAYKTAVAMNCRVVIPDFYNGKVRSSFQDLVDLDGIEKARELLLSPVDPPEDWDVPWTEWPY